MAKIYQVVAVYDNLTEHFFQPQFCESIEDAERMFAFQVNSIQLWKENASDYELYLLGQFDAESGTLLSEVHKRIKGTAVLKKGEENDLQSVDYSSQA